MGIIEKIKEFELESESLPPLSREARGRERVSARPRVPQGAAAAAFRSSTLLDVAAFRLGSPLVSGPGLSAITYPLPDSSPSRSEPHSEKQGYRVS